MIVHHNGNVPKIELLCAGDRLALQHPRLDAEKGFLEATNTYALVRYPVEVEEGDRTGYVPAEALKGAAKIQRKQFRNELYISVGEQVHVRMGPTYPQPLAPDTKFPDFEQLIPENLSEFSIGVNAKLLYDLSRALGANHDTVELRFTTDKEGNPSSLRPILVTCTESILASHKGEEKREAVGLLMPVKMAGR